MTEQQTLPPDCEGDCDGQAPCPHRIPCWRMAEYRAGLDCVDADPEDPDA